MTCNHERTTNHLVTEDDGWEEPVAYWETRTEYTTVDLDTHRYQCTQCKKIMYYSGAARAYYEDGVKSQVHGLGV